MRSARRVDPLFGGQLFLGGGSRPSGSLPRQVIVNGGPSPVFFRRDSHNLGPAFKFGLSLSSNGIDEKVAQKACTSEVSYPDKSRKRAHQSGVSERVVLLPTRTTTEAATESGTFLLHAEFFGANVNLARVER